MKKNKEWLKNEILGLSIKARHKENNQREWHMGHEMALFDVNKLIDQLDEPQKPVIPQFVADYIEKWKHKGLTIYEWFTFGNNDIDEDIDKWLYNNTIEENRRREYLLIEAIRNGYEVEKEKLYHVVNGENYFMLRKDDGLVVTVVTMQVSPAMSRDKYGKDTRFMLTEKEIKDYDERYFAFAEDVTK